MYANTGKKGMLTYLMPNSTGPNENGDSEGSLPELNHSHQAQGEGEQVLLSPTEPPGT